MVIITDAETPASSSASPWTDDSGPNIIEIMNDPEARELLTPADLGILLTVRFLHFSPCL